jgi:polygalacturonase
VIADGATLAFSRDPSGYLPLVLTRFEGVEMMNYSPFIYAFEQQNIGISGGGMLDGQADAGHWWAWRERQLGPNGDRARLTAWWPAACRSRSASLAPGNTSDRFVQPSAVRTF